MWPSWLEICANIDNIRMYLYFKEVDRMACFTCKKTGIRECNAMAAADNCAVCGFCEAEKKRKEREAVKNAV